MNKRLILLMIFLAACLSPLNAFAQDDNGAKDASEAQIEEAPKAATDAQKTGDADEEDDKCWGVLGEASVSLGLGAFTKDEHARKIRSRFALQVGAYYTIPVIDVDLHAETGFTQWISKAGGTNGQYEFRWSDSNIGFSREIWTYENKRKEFSVKFEGDLSFVLPTSKISQTENLYTGISPTLTSKLGFGPLRFGYEISYTHYFHKYTSRTFDPSEVDVLSRYAGNEILGSHDIAGGGILVEMALVNKFSIGYKFMDELSMNVGFGFADTWTYKTKSNKERDEYTNKYAHVGRGHQQISGGNISLTYTPLKYLGLTLLMSSEQPWKTADQKTYRFPWFDTISPSKNYTKFIFVVNAQY